ncbi:ATP-binding protein [Frankia sp. CNm7]|uniref:ATP-binding protein n=1 Tax=Frankia nepalensis TaxID=1836974 RepID=A0A937UQE0_9ACTN|nr:ATP-binding protein [Frankia nepalensis]MBL7494850.1 ATP-binding protein [Frankia nepalensis]MBL7512204.1 ATP-binding protein [Frankia nepalensis]MBL7518219.1 ATP-binding protein [Frankia nepalensis]MBL7626581.1 ATP-binding protein [Frankia nepalensis]
MKQVVTHVTPVPAAVPLLRAKTVDQLAEWAVTPKAVETAELVVCELATNAVRASRLQDEYIAIRLSATNGTVIIEVWSRNDDAEPRLVHPDEDSETGRGLAIIGALSTRWDAYRAQRGGIVVWAQFPGAILPEPGALADATPLSVRVAHRIPDPDPDLPAVEFNNDPDLLARVADRLRALDPWHDSPATPISATAPVFVASAPNTQKEGRDPS